MFPYSLPEPPAQVLDHTVPIAFFLHPAGAADRTHLLYRKENGHKGLSGLFWDTELLIQSLGHDHGCPISEKVLSPYSLLTRVFRSQGAVELAIQGQSASLKLSPRWLLCCSPLQNLYLNPEAQDKSSFHTVITPAFLPVHHGRPHQYLSRPRCLAMGPLRK